MKKITLIIFQILLFSGLFAQQTDSLAKYINFGLKNNPQVLVAFNNYKAAYEKIDYIKGLPDPTISAGVFISSVETRQGPQLAKISITQMFPWFGTLSYRGKQAAAFANAQYNFYVDKANAIAFNISKKYYQLYFLKKKIQIIKTQILLYKKLENDALVKFQTSNGTSVDVLVFQMAKDELKIQLENTLDKLAEKQKVFNILLTKNKNEDVYVPDTLMFSPVVKRNIDTVILNNPTIVANNYLLESFYNKYKADKLSTYPKIGIGLDYAVIGKDPSLPTSGRDAIMPMFTISIPIYGKKNKALNKSNKFLIQKSLDTKISAVDKLSSQLVTWQKNYDVANREYKLYGELIAKAEQSLQILYASYATSESDYDQIIFIENTILKYKIAELNAIYEIKTYEKQYLFLSGNLFTNK